jgi:hypothetical protein
MFQLLINCSGTSAEVTILVGAFASGTKNSRDMASWFWRAESRCWWVLFFGLRYTHARCLSLFPVSNRFMSSALVLNPIILPIIKLTKINTLLRQKELKQSRHKLLNVTLYALQLSIIVVVGLRAT